MTNKVQPLIGTISFHFFFFISYRGFVSFFSFLNSSLSNFNHLSIHNSYSSIFENSKQKDEDEKSGSAFGQLENGAQHITRQVSSRIQKGTIVRKRLAKESWHGAADKVRVIFHFSHKLFCIQFFSFTLFPLLFFFC